MTFPLVILCWLFLFVMSFRVVTKGKNKNGNTGTVKFNYWFQFFDRFSILEIKKICGFRKYFHLIISMFMG